MIRYVCPNCGASRLSAGRARKTGDFVFIYYHYECGTVLTLSRYKDKAKFHYNWDFRCEAKDTTLQ